MADVWVGSCLASVLQETILSVFETVYLLYIYYMVLTLDIVPHTKQRMQRKVPLRDSAGLCFPGVRRISQSGIET